MHSQSLKKNLMRKNNNNNNNKTKKKGKGEKKRVTKVTIDKYADTALFPPIKPIKEYKIKVSKLHTLYYATYGNPKGKPVIYVHGGPGGGTTPDMARFFNPKFYYIVLVDQRGSGKSTPIGELRENTTDDLIDDFEKIRKSLEIKKWQVYGGSWGSTLSLVYAIKHPEVATELVLRGIFLGGKEEVEWTTQPNGAEKFNPEGWELFKNVIPVENRTNYLKAYGECFKGKYGKKAKKDGLIAWSAWEDSLSQLHPLKMKDILDGFKKDDSYIQMSLIEQHYFSNDLFFEKDYILNNVDKLKNIPTVIVNGMYDMECPIVTATKLHKAMPHSVFHRTFAGHTCFDDENIKYLVQATNDFIKKKNDGAKNDSANVENGGSNRNTSKGNKTTSTSNKGEVVVLDPNYGIHNPFPDVDYHD